MISWITLFVTIFVFLKLLVLIFQSFEGRTQKVKKNTRSVLLAVVIPAHNEEELIAKTIKSIVEAGVSTKDIFVLPNGCTDNTEAEVLKSGLRLYKIPHQGKALALDYAIHELNLFRDYTHVCLVDADTLVDRSYFKAVRDRLRTDPTADIVCGRPKSSPHNGLTAYRAMLYWTYHSVHKAGQEKLRSILVVPGCAGTYSVQVLKKIEWSNDTPTEDMDATLQAALKGYKIVFEKNAVVYTQDPATIKDYVKQMNRWYAGYWMNMRKHGILWKGSAMLNWDCRLAVIEQILYLFFLVPYPIFRQLTGGENPWGMAIMLLPIIALNTTICSLVCAYTEKRKDILKYLPLYPLLMVLDLILSSMAIPKILSEPKNKGACGWSSPERYEIE